MKSETWVDSLRLENRHFPEFIRPNDNVNGLPHSSAIRQSFDELNLDAIHCISGVPSIAFLEQDEIDKKVIDSVHKALWNQGLASLLVVITNKEILAYSLSQLPTEQEDHQDKLVRVFDLVSDALELKEFVQGVESGRFVTENSEKFSSDNRIDQVLLSNLLSTVGSLVESNLTLEEAQAVLMQIMFIAYLEDRNIICKDYYKTVTDKPNIKSLEGLLNNGQVSIFNDVFRVLKKHFNGDLFVAPCSFEENQKTSKLNNSHISVLAQFRSGNIHLESGQYQFWPYNFKYIPVELISAIYDRFLGFKPDEKRVSGAYYTPMFLADLVVEQGWAELSEEQKLKGKVFDPACGSGIFLVRLFLKMIDCWRINHKNQKPSWPALLAILKRIHGSDIQKSSVRVAAFSLYIALLENTKPAEILKLMEKGRLLPKLFGENLNVYDFFKLSEENTKYDLIIGNPPWVSRRGKQEGAQKWCSDHEFTMPAGELAWGFVWKSLAHAKENTVIALLVKATSFLTNHNPTSIKARHQWLSNSKVLRIINFADMCFQLFEGVSAPTALLLYRKNEDDAELNYTFDYWVPKADLNSKSRKIVNLSSVDKASLRLDIVLNDNLLMKRRMWMQTPDAKLFQYINNFPKLSKTGSTYKDDRLNIELSKKNFVIGQGFIPAQEDKLGNENYKTSYSKVVLSIPHLPTAQYSPFVMPSINTSPWQSNVVYRKGYEEGFKAPHILIPQGIEREVGRLRASYCTQDLTFRHSIQAISFRKINIKQAKFLTLLLNSSLIAWYLFHNSSNTGMERDKVHQEQILEIPFPVPEDMANKEKAENAFKDAVEIIDTLLKKKDQIIQDDHSFIYSKIDKAIYRYFDLSEEEIQIIEDAINYILPSMQPRSRTKTLPKLWMNTNEADWKNYATTLAKGLSKWIEEPYRPISEVVGISSDLVVLGVQLTDSADDKIFQKSTNIEIDYILDKIWKNLPHQLPGNFQLIPDLRIFIDDVLYLVKPRIKRYWLGSTALADADAIASDLLSQID